MKVVYDTCIYIDLLRSRQRMGLFEDRAHIRFMSPIVMMELRAGAINSHLQKIVDQLLEPYSKALRIIELHSNLYYKAGDCLSKLRRVVPHRGFSNDLLIALSAISIGATLFTSNCKDFEKISKVLPLKWEGV